MSESDKDTPVMEDLLNKVNTEEDQKMVKAHLLKSASSVERSQQIANVLTQDPSSFTDKRTIDPPYDPERLSVLFWHSNSLRQNVDAYVTNIDGFGHRFEQSLDLEDDDIDKIIKLSLIQEDSAQNDFARELPTQEKVAARKAQIEAQMANEHSKLKFFFQYCHPGTSFTKLRKMTRQDLEITGNAYWEVQRDQKGRISTFNLLPSHTMRLTHEDKEPILTSQRVHPTPITCDKRHYYRRFRRFVQIDKQHSVYFKEFNDRRVISSKTGEPYDTVEALYAEEGIEVRPANEVIHFKLHASNTPYGVPRWIGVLTSVLGSRKADEVNLLYFDNKSIPPMAMLVSGGRVTEETIGRIQDHIENEVKGSNNWHDILIIEGEGPLTQGGTENTGRMKIELKPLTQAISSDALFQNYDEKNIRKVGMSFRLPPLLRGDSRDFNRATALAVLKFTETQVFQPERLDFDDLINRTILSELDIQFWKFVSNSPKATDPQDQAKVLETLTKVGAVVPSEAREIASEILNKDLRKVRDPWVDVPFPLTVAGRVDDVLILGELIDIIESAMLDGKITPEEHGLIEEASQELAPDNLEEAAESKPGEDSEDTEETEEAEKALSPEQEEKLKKLPPTISKRITNILTKLNSSQNTRVIKVPQEEWEKWEEGLIKD